MATLNREQVVANFQQYAGTNTYDLTHETLQLTKTATMTHGTLLVAAGTEAVAGDLDANVTHVIDDPKVDFAAVGDVVTVSAVADLDAVKFYGSALKLGSTPLSTSELTTFAKKYA